MKCVKVLAGAAAVLGSTTAMAGTLTGNVGVVSDYMFRGIDQSAQGAAVQGGVDSGFKFGLYTGLLVPNAAAANGNEADVYVGYGLTLAGISLDGGVIYYAYTEDTEAVNTGTRTNLDYAEAYIGGSLGPVSLKVFYAPEFGADTGGAVTGDNDKNEMMYATISATLALTQTVSVTPQIGMTTGDGAKDAFGDEYADYSITATKKLKDDMSVSLAVIGTDLETTVAPGVTNSDNPKFVIGFKRNFKI
jgi:uncharacterized protein (TIGR02001 family)